MSRPIIEVEHLAKKYRLGVVGATTLRDDVARLVNRLRGRETTEKGEFWALRDVSFRIEPGEIVGIIGRNGAGKSTLLKVLSRITEPTAGRVIMRGRVASLLEVGTGFHADLTGRENVFLNGAILGMKRPEIAARFDEIVAFAEVDQFIDTPVKHYSSGMRVRLAFAVAAFLESEVLIIDEVLAVGDVAFQNKCLNRIQSDLSHHSRTVLLVSHQMHSIRAICERVILLKQGKVAYSGDTATAIDLYSMEQAITDLRRVELGDRPRVRPELGAVARIMSLDVDNGDGVLRHGDPVRLRINWDNVGNRPLTDIAIGVGLCSSDGHRLATYDSDLNQSRAVIAAGQRMTSELHIPRLPFQPGNYLIDLAIRQGDDHSLDYLPGSIRCTILAGAATPAFIIRADAGVRLEGSWGHTAKSSPAEASDRRGVL